MKQEVCHRIMSESFIDRTHSPRYINLKNDQIRIDIVANTNKDGNTESAASANATEKSTGVDTADASSEGSDSDTDTTHNQKQKQKKKINLTAAKTIVDLYGERLSMDNWSDHSLYNIYVNSDFEKTGETKLKNMSLDTFAKRFDVGKNKIKKLNDDKFVIFTPKLTGSLKSATYPLFCKYSLIRYTVWTGQSFEAYGGLESTEEEWKRLWTKFAYDLQNDNIGNEANLDFQLLQVLDNTRYGTPRNKFLEGDLLTNDDDDDDAEEQDMSYYGLIHHDDIDDDDYVVENWTKTLKGHKDHPSYIQSSVQQHTFDDVKKAVDSILDQNFDIDNENIEFVDSGMLNNEQKMFFDLMQIIMTTFFEEPDSDVSASDGGSSFHRGIVLKGKGGTGKTTTVNAVRSAFFVKPGEIMTTATTGKAAMLISGATIYNAKKGLKLPVGRSKYTDLKGKVLQELQKLTKDLKVLFIDEYSMLPQKCLYYIDLRLKQLKQSDRAFGGVVIVMIGDLSQLPPVQAIPVWDVRFRTDSGNLKDQDSMNGMSLWCQHFRTVIKLEQNKRLDGKDPDALIAAEILEGISEGELTESNFQRIIATCSKQTMGNEEWTRRGFEVDSATHLFSRNKDVLQHNHQRLQQLDNPILKIEAYNKTKAAKAKKSECFQQLENQIYLAVDALSLLTTNLQPSIGLANGSTGVVKQIVWNSTATDDTISDAANLFVWIDFGEQYSGPSFFDEDESRKGWFPIFARTAIHTEADSSSRGYKVHERIMLPLKLSWAWTIHKAQGQTIRDKVILDLGKQEMSLGLSYVAFSRATRLSNIGIVGGITKERLTTVIQKKAGLKRRQDADKLLDKYAVSTKALLINIQNTRLGTTFGLGDTFSTDLNL